MPILEKIVDSLTRLFGPSKEGRKKAKATAPRTKASKRKPTKPRAKPTKVSRKRSNGRQAKSYKKSSTKSTKSSKSSRKKQATKKAVKKVAKKATKKTAPKKPSVKAKKKTRPVSRTVKKVSKPSVKKGGKPKAKSPKSHFSKPREILVGEITHFFGKISVVVVHLKHYQLAQGDKIHVVGRGVDFTQKVKSLQIESVDVKIARKGKMVGLKIAKQAKPGDKVYKIL